MVVSGLLLVVAGVGLGLYLVPLMQHGSASFHSSATPAQTGAIAMLFTVLAIFGGVSAVHGVMTIARGQRSRVMQIVTFVLLAVLVGTLVHTLNVMPHQP